MDRREVLKLIIAGLGLGMSKGYNISDYNNYRQEPSKNEHIIAAVGNITLENYFDKTLAYLKNNSIREPYDYMLKDIIGSFNDVDIGVGNLECALTDATSHKSKPNIFVGKPQHALFLKKLHMDIVGLGNNHFMDYHDIGAIDTLKTLNESNIRYFGGGKDMIDASTPRFIEHSGLKFGFLGYAIVGKNSRATTETPGTNPYDVDTARLQISSAKDLCDILIVSCHWGQAHSNIPSDGQIKAAKIFVDSGADIVLGHHPHVLQQVHEYNHKLIFYSLGDFIYGGSKNPDENESMIAKIRISQGGIIDYKEIPIITHQDNLVLPKIEVKKYKREFRIYFPK